MSRSAFFEEADLREQLPDPGVYASTVASARLRRSATGNRMVLVVHVLDGVPAGHDRGAEYVVLEGACPRGLGVSRRRLVDLYRACGLCPRPGDDIAPEQLVGARLVVKVEHAEWQGQTRLRVVAHRPLPAAPTTEGPSC